MYDKGPAVIPFRMKQDLVTYLIENSKIIKVVPTETVANGRRKHHIYFDSPSPELHAFLMRSAEEGSIMYDYFINTAMLLPTEAVTLLRSIEK